MLDISIFAFENIPLCTLVAHLNEMSFASKHSKFERLYTNFVINLKAKVIFTLFSSARLDLNCPEYRILTVNSRESLELGRCFLSSIWKETKVMHVIQEDSHLMKLVHIPYWIEH